MPIIHFTGKLLPEFLKITVKGLPEIKFNEPPTPPLPQGLRINYLIDINDSVIDMKCDAEPVDEHHVHWIYNRAVALIRMLIDLHSFATGSPVDVVLDTIVYPSGERRPLQLANPHLVGLCTVTESNKPTSTDMSAVMQHVFKEPALQLPLRDLITGITYPTRAAVDCARAIEGLRQILSPGVDGRKKGWELLQTNLAVSEDYLKLITRTSEGPRHGNGSYIDGTTIDEVTRRSWIIMNRFFQFRLRGSHPLPIHEFPVL